MITIQERALSVVVSKYQSMFVALGGVVVTVFATGPKVRGIKPIRDDGFLRAIKIRSMTSFRGK
jgi:hypothetical protein